MTHCLFQSAFVSDYEFVSSSLFVKLSMLVNWSDYLIHLVPAKYFALGFLKLSLPVIPIMMENQLAPATQFELLKL